MLKIFTACDDPVREWDLLESTQMSRCSVALRVAARDPES